LPYPVVWPSAWSRVHLRKIMSNTVISKLWDVCRTQSCDSLCDLEIIWGLKMSNLLNLIFYSLACLLTCTNWVLICICVRLAKHASRIIVAFFEMMPSEFIYVFLLRYESLCLWWTWLTCVFTLFHILAFGYLLVIF
jgi:hypothetical protein